MSTLSALPPFRSRVVPVVVIADDRDAVPLAETLLGAGIDVIEVTLRSAAALRAIEAIVKSVPGMAVGAGTVTRPAQVQQVIDAGAAFALAPGWTPALLQAARDRGLPFIPGVATASEALQAHEHGCDLLKFFPAAQSGGIAMLKAWRGPLPELRFCPTGGVDEANHRQYLAEPNVALVGGTWLAPAAWIEERAWDRIAATARRIGDPH